MENCKNPAYPISGDLLDKCGQVDFNPFGLTKREYFAAMAMQGLLSNPNRGGEQRVPESIAFDSIFYAHELLKQLEL